MTTKVYLKDYTPPNYTVEQVDLDIRLFDDYALVDSVLVMTCRREGELVLLGRELELRAISLNDKPLDPSHYKLDKESLRFDPSVVVGEQITLSTQVVIYPNTNTALEGLYLAGTLDDPMYVTQCEAEGFRKITFYPDRPDVLSVFTTRIEADKKFKTLLGNGNLIDQGEIDGGRHFAVWHDPIKKPSYLFACVVADLAVIQDRFTTMEGREVLLEIYAEPKDIDKCHVAMQALKDSMRWDEENYGRAYDLDRFMVVATGYFNMGAMENKGLNIFNTAYVLATPDSATDQRNFAVKAVIAHEYFHNWTGNRITCRDWFQLCLKEGLTVYRDQSFSGDFRSKAVQRIDDVAVLRSAQFSEDAGALAHPVRPDSFVEINNFYTATVYEKGAEIVRMMANLLGKEKYRRAMDLYFERFDGQAVTIEDYIDTLATEDKRIGDFLQWYKQPATPVIKGSYRYDDDGVYLDFTQSIRHVKGYDAPKPLPIPIDVAVFDKDDGTLLASELMLLTKEADTFRLPIKLNGKHPLVSVLRGFSAPVIVQFEYSDDELVALAMFENDGFNRWQALGMLVERYLLGKLDTADDIVKVLAQTTDELLHTEPMLATRLFDIPSEKQWSVQFDSDYHPKAVQTVHRQLRQAIADGLKDKLEGWYQALPIQAYEDDPKKAGERALRNVVLGLIALTDTNKADTLATNQYDNANCMSERFGALSVMVDNNLPSKAHYLAKFYEQFADDELAIDDWFAVQASSDMDTTQAAALMEHADYKWNNPNRARSVLSALAARPVFLWSDEGLALYLQALVKLDDINPQLSARLLTSLARWYTLNSEQKQNVKAQLLAFKDQVHSKNVLEQTEQLLLAD